METLGGRVRSSSFPWVADRSVRHSASCASTLPSLAAGRARAMPEALGSADEIARASVRQRHGLFSPTLVAKIPRNLA
jgi:hypothetical protein